MVLVLDIPCSSSLDHVKAVYVSFLMGSQTVLAYSTVGRTRALYAVSLVKVEEILRFLRRKLMVRLALLQVFCICWPQSMWLFRVQPRYLAEVTCSSVWP